MSRKTLNKIIEDFRTSDNILDGGDIADRINQLALLGQGDDENDVAPTVKSASELYDFLIYQYISKPLLGTHNDGSLGASWRGNEGRRLYVRFTGDGTVTFSYADSRIAKNYTLSGTVPSHKLLGFLAMFDLDGWVYKNETE